MWGLVDYFVLNFSEFPIWRERLFLSLEFNDTTGGLELLFGELGDVAGADDAGAGDDTVAEELSLTVGEEVNDGEVTTLLDGGGVGDHLGELVEVDGGLPGGVGLLVEVAHTQLTEVSRVVLIEVDAVMVRATGVTTTGGMLLVLTNTAVTVELGTAHAAGLAEASRHDCCCCFVGCCFFCFFPRR